MSKFTQELREILPINSEEKLDAVFKLMSRWRTVIITYIDATIYRYLTDTNLWHSYCQRTGRLLVNVLSEIEIGTVHTFQGSESDVIIFDMVDCSKFEKGEKPYFGKIFSGEQCE